MIAFATAPGNVPGATLVPRCGCGKLRQADRPRCCTPCGTGAHSVSCHMSQVSLAELAGLPVVSSFVYFCEAGTQ